jgi:RNA polymerase sigma-70 factor (ECF subfamily)
VPNEQEAIIRLKQGDISGLALLVELYQVQAVRTAYLITGSRAHAEDIVQSAFLTAYKCIEQFDSERRFGPWFLRSVVNAALKAVTRQKELVPLDDDGAAGMLDLLPGPDDVVEHDEMREQIKQALMKLAAKQRAAIVMRYYLDLSEEEMAEEMACVPGTVKWRLHAARERLRIWLKPLAGGRL